MTDGRGAERAQTVVRASLAANALFLVAAALVGGALESRLVLAQAADSTLDVLGGVLLAWSVRLSREPRDEGHPFGHGRAEPLGALVTAVLAGVLGFEVLQGAVASLVSGRTAEIGAAAGVLLAAKLVAKVVIAVAARRGEGPALRAVFVDARNDTLACSGSLVGFALARIWGWLDAALAVPIALYIVWSGVGLARENLRYLMGEAPPREVLDELRARAAGVEDVRAVRPVRAHWIGPTLQVEVAITVDEDASATRAHDIALRVQERLEEHPDVEEVFVHVDTPAARPH